MSPDLSQFSMHDLFRLEVDGQREVLTAGLLKLEREPTAAAELEACMRSAHSLKGAARIVGLSAAVVVAHAMEDAFVAAQRGAMQLDQARIGLMLRGLDLLVQVANTPEAEAAPWQDASAPAAQAFVAELEAALAAPAVPASAPPPPSPPAEPENESPAPAPATVAKAAKPKRAARREPSPDAEAQASARERRREVERRAQADRDLPERRSNIERHIVAAPVAARAEPESRERTLRVAAQNLNRLLGLSGEALVESRWVAPFAESLLRLKRMQVETGRKLAQVQDRLPVATLDEPTQAGLSELRARLADAEGYLAQRLEELELYDQRSGSVARRLYDEAIACRMRPFGDRIGAFPRLVRDLGVELHKRVQLQILGEDTQVDRDVLDKLEAPLSHLLRNAVDHGMESPAERERAGKPAEGRVTLEARHAAGMLQISVSDDGRGIDLERVRAAVVQRGLSTDSVVAQLTEAELLEFLFLPGFTVRDTVTEISGRGVGLDAVQDMVKQLRGSLRVSTEPGRGARFQMHLPLTVSVVRALVAEIGGEPYAFPLAFIANTVSVPRERIQVLEGRQHFDSDGRQVGLVSAVQVLGGKDPPYAREALPVVVVGDQHTRYGLVVDRFLGVRELVVQPLDPRLGKIKDISAGALLDNGTPVLIVDTFDLLRSIDKLIAAGHLDKVGASLDRRHGPRRKRVLVVEDSLTVRELERKLIEGGGFEVEVAVDGADGWNAVRVGHFDLVVTDVDMPRMDGIALVAMIKQDQRLAHTPVMIVSYKDREEDRRRGLEAGADFYLTKGSFHDETLLQAVHDLVGDALARDEAPAEGALMRVAIVNDSPMALEALRRSLGFKSGLKIAWTAMDGADAVAKCAADTPDLVLMDLIMPGMDGVEATRRIMAASPCAILVVTASIGAQSSRTFEAMGHGALDAVDTPELGLGEDRAAAETLLRKISTIGRLIGDKPPKLASVSGIRKHPGSPLVAIGASSGGPAALAKLLSALPADLPAPVLIVQHIDQQFAPGMADWLKQYSPWPVQVAGENERPEPGKVLLAGTADHLVFKSPERVGYTPDPVAAVHRPSVDVFFDSCNRHWRGDIYAALLTGMGRDGAVAMKALRDKGHYTVAQDAATSAVYGMPKAAADLGAAAEVLPLQGIGPRLAQLVAGESWRKAR